MCPNQRPWFISQKIQLPLGLPIRLYQFLKPWVQILIWLHLIWPKKHVTMDFWHCQSCFNSASSRIKVALILAHFEKRKKNLEQKNRKQTFFWLLHLIPYDPWGIPFFFLGVFCTWHNLSRQQEQIFLPDKLTNEKWQCQALWWQILILHSNLEPPHWSYVAVSSGKIKALSKK